MKLSVSVPDWLWIMCKLTKPDAGASEIVQEALAGWIKQNPRFDELLTEAGRQVIEGLMP